MSGLARPFTRLSCFASLLLSLSTCCFAEPSIFSILDYGAVSSDSSNNASYANSKAIEQALAAANSSAGIALVPAGAIFYIFKSQVLNPTSHPFYVWSEKTNPGSRRSQVVVCNARTSSSCCLKVNCLQNVTFQIDGTLVINNNITEWESGVVNFTAALNFYQCSGLTIQGRGTLDYDG